MRARRSLARVHIWLGWLIGMPLLFWTVSGLWMVARPIDEVRGTALLAPPAAIIATDLRLPTLSRPVVALSLEQQVRGPRWIVTHADGRVMRADATTGNTVAPVDRAEAEAIARRAYLAKAAIERVTRYSAASPPIDLRRPRPAWQVRFTDGANLYVDAETGQVLALRTRQWRAFDWMWGLHIMDLREREDTNHPVLIGFAALAALGVLLGLALLPLASRPVRRRR